MKNMDYILFWKYWFRSKEKKDGYFSDVSPSRLHEGNLELFSAALAWGHYLYERDFGVDGLKEKIKIYEANQGVTVNVCKKFLVISLNDGCINIHGSNKELDKIELALPLNKDLHDVAGSRNRPYQLPVCKIKKKNQRVYYVSDSPSCIQTVKQMHLYAKKIAITDEMKKAIYKRITQWLTYLITKDKKVNDMITVIIADARNLGDCLVQGDINENNNFEFKKDFSYKGIGAVLPLQYFYNYLLYIFPDLQKRMELWEKSQSVSLVRKLFILVPYSGNTRRALNDRGHENNIEYIGKLKDQRVCIGFQERDYPLTVYKISNDEISHYYCLAEYATPARQLYKMCDHRLSAKYFCEEGFLVSEIKKFAETLIELLKDHQLTHLCQVISFDDNEIQELAPLLFKHCVENTSQNNPSC